MTELRNILEKVSRPDVDIAEIEQQIWSQVVSKLPERKVTIIKPYLFGWNNCRGQLFKNLKEFIKRSER